MKRVKIAKWVSRNSHLIQDARKIIEGQGYDMSEPVDLLLIFLEEGLASILDTDPDHEEIVNRRISILHAHSKGS